MKKNEDADDDDDLADGDDINHDWSLGLKPSHRGKSAKPKSLTLHPLRTGPRPNYLFLGFLLG